MPEIIMVLAMPPYFLIILAFCFLVIFAGKMLFRIRKDDMNDYFMSLVFPVWGIDLVAWFFSNMIALMLTNRIPYFSGIWTTNGA